MTWVLSRNYPFHIAIMTSQQQPAASSGHPKVKEVLERVWTIHQQKNSDYSEAGHQADGDPFSNFRECEDFGIDTLSGILVRMSDKWSRLKNLHAKNGENAVPGEGLEDALLDLIGYAAIYLAELSDQEDSDVDLDIAVVEPEPSFDRASMDIDEFLDNYKPGYHEEHCDCCYCAPEHTD